MEQQITPGCAHMVGTTLFTFDATLTAVSSSKVQSTGTTVVLELFRRQKEAMNATTE
jgi:hypothetical protein